MQPMVRVLSKRVDAQLPSSAPAIIHLPIDHCYTAWAITIISQEVQDQ